MSKALLIVFVKNPELGKVKTRLAKDIGDEGALAIYNTLLNITEKVIDELDIDKRIYFSERIVNTNWGRSAKYIQKGVDLGERMMNAFADGFKDDYNRIILIGSDLPDLSSQIIQEGFKGLERCEMVFGPAEDGGYYLVGMNKMNSFVFENKKWSTGSLLEDTLEELQRHDTTFSLLKTLNDIDTLEDLTTSQLY